MATLEALQRRIAHTEDLQSVVKTMKALAVVSIRQYEQAVVALAQYHHVIELGLQALLRERPEAAPTPLAPAGATVGALVFGSDQGMVGQFNQQIVGYAHDTLNGMRVRLSDRRIIVVGERAAALIDDTDAAPEAVLPVPGSVGAITPLVHELLLRVDAWRDEQQLGRLILFYNATRSGGGYRPSRVHLLPLEAEWIATLRRRPWPSRRLPTYTLERERLFSALIEQHLFVAIFRACAESLAGEHASRLAAMQSAEGNIADRLEELTRTFHQQRQEAITEELLDIVAGVQAQE